MTTLQSSSSPASLRSGSSAPRENRNGFGTDPRPYLITGQRRKSVVSVKNYLSLFPHEAEDARMTGSTRSLYRRLLALNLPGAVARYEVSAERHLHVIGGVFDAGSKIA